MNKLLIDYLKTQGFGILYVNYKAMHTSYKENAYNASCKDYKRFIFLEWGADANYPSVKVFVCDNNSTQDTRGLIGYISVATINAFKKGLKKCYIERYGYLRWYFRPIIKPFFKYLKAHETKHNLTT